MILIGFMGAGKSCVGRALAAELKWAFHDLDERIEIKEGRTIADIFRSSGEARFRRIEQGALESMLRESGLQEKCVIALGGGAFIQEANVALIQESGIPTIFLDAKVEELWDRCQDQAFTAVAQRPLVRDREEFRLVYEQRRRHYLKASFRHETGGKTIARIAAELIEVLKLNRRTKSGDKK